jgi:hypothetical protein
VIAHVTSSEFPLLLVMVALGVGIGIGWALRALARRGGERRG